jgi:hypothetical protein
MLMFSLWKGIVTSFTAYRENSEILAQVVPKQEQDIELAELFECSILKVSTVVS